MVLFGRLRGVSVRLFPYFVCRRALFLLGVCFKCLSALGSVCNGRSVMFSENSRGVCMNKLFLSICLFVLGSTAVMAESLSVFSEDPSAKIYVNGRQVGVQALVNYEVTPGEYLVKVIVAQGVAYSQLVAVDRGASKVINTTRFVPAATNNIPDRSAKLIEGARLKLSRGVFGIGFEVGPISGLSMKYDIDNNWGVGVTGWYSSNNEVSNSSFLGSVYYALMNTMVNNQSASVYLCGSLGGGQEKGNSGSPDNDVNVSSLSVGVFQQGGLFFGSVDNSFVNFEVGLGAINRSVGDRYSGIVLKLGQQFFF